MPGVARKRSSASFVGLRPASSKSSRIAAKASRKQGTKCEMKLCEALRDIGLVFSINDRALPGCPDLVFYSEKLAVFVDGDFWHGRNFPKRVEKLVTGHNGEYWIRKIQSNMARDRAVSRQLKATDWHVIRIWEGQINSHLHKAVARIVKALGDRTL